MNFIHIEAPVPSKSDPRYTFGTSFLILLTAGRGRSAEACGLDDVFPPDDLCSRPETLC